MKLVFILAIVSFSLQAQAQKTKYGVVDMQMVILSVEEGRQARKKLEQEIKKKEKVLLKSKQELEKLNKEWQSQSPLLSDAAKLKKQQKFQEKFVNLRNSELEFQADIKRREQKATKDIAIKVADLVEEMAVDMGLDAVFETNSAGLLYLKDPVNLTARVIEKYNKTYKVAKKK